MIKKLRPRSVYDVMAALSLLLVVTGGTAYAANTIFSSDIVDGQVKTPDLANAAVATEKLAGGAVSTDKVKDANLTGRDVFDNSLKGADIDESTLSNIGGGGAAGGDLTGTYPNPLIRSNAVRGGKVADNSLTGSDIDEGSLLGVNASTLDGETANQLGSAAIHLIGDQQHLLFQFGSTYIYANSFCQSDWMEAAFTAPGGGTENLMAFVDGVETPTTEPNWINLESGGRRYGRIVPDDHEVRIGLGDTAGFAAAEIQLVVDSPEATYSVALHMFHLPGASPYCETFGTATLGL